MPFTKGQRVRMLCESVGDDANDVERTYPVGTLAVIDDIDERGIHHVVVGPDNDDSIVQCFDAGPEAEAAMQALPPVSRLKAHRASRSGPLCGVFLVDQDNNSIGYFSLDRVRLDHAERQALRDRIVAAINAGQAEGRVHHPGRGATYDVVATEALFQVSERQDLHGIEKGRIVEDGDAVTVYRNPDGKHFVRFPDEMVSPRFEKV